MTRDEALKLVLYLKEATSGGEWSDERWAAFADGLMEFSYAAAAHGCRQCVWNTKGQLTIAQVREWIKVGGNDPARGRVDHEITSREKAASGIAGLLEHAGKAAHEPMSLAERDVYEQALRDPHGELMLERAVPRNDDGTAKSAKQIFEDITGWPVKGPSMPQERRMTGKRPSVSTRVLRAVNRTLGALVMLQYLNCSDALAGTLRLKLDGRPPLVCEVTHCTEPVRTPAGDRTPLPSPIPTGKPKPGNLPSPSDAVSLNALLSDIPGARGLDGQGVRVGEERWYYLDISGSFATLRSTERASAQCSNFALCVQDTSGLRCDGNPSIGAEHGISLTGPGRAYVRITGLQTCATQDGLSNYMIWWQ